MSDMQRSKEAIEQGVCHTSEECHELYKQIPEDVRLAAVNLLREKIPITEQELIIRTQKIHGKDWMLHLMDEEIEKVEIEYRGSPALDFMIAMMSGKGHFGFGMRIRNFLRANNMGEKEFGVHNLDDIYIELIEEAVLKGEN